jgi:hypothetical protein
MCYRLFQSRLAQLEFDNEQYRQCATTNMTKQQQIENVKKELNVLRAVYELSDSQLIGT